MSIIDDIRVRQTFDPAGENGGYSFEAVEETKILRVALYRYNGEAAELVLADECELTEDEGGGLRFTDKRPLSNKGVLPRVGATQMFIEELHRKLFFGDDT